MMSVFGLVRLAGCGSLRACVLLTLVATAAAQTDAPPYDELRLESVFPAVGVSAPRSMSNSVPRAPTCSRRAAW